ncbi:MAG: methyl-accepting chemotaxis protein [Bacteroidota bacterium]
MKWYNNLEIGKKLLYAFLFISLLMSATSFYGIIQMNSLADSTTYLYENSVVSLRDLGLISSKFERVNAIMRDEALTSDQSAIQGRSRDWHDLEKEIGILLQEYEKSITTQEERDIFTKFLPEKKEFGEKLEEFDNYAFSGNTAACLDLLNNGMLKSRREYRKVLQSLIDYNIKLADEVKSQSNSSASSSIIATSVLSVIAVIAAILLGTFIARNLKNSVNKLLEFARELQRGHVKVRTNIDTEDEIGKMASVLDVFATQLEQFAGAMHKIAIEGDVSIRVPSYDAEDMLAPALNSIGETLTGLINEAEQLTKSAVEGKLATRGNAEKFRGGFRDIISGVNSTLDAVIKPIDESAKVLAQMASGDLTVRMNGDYKGDFLLIKNSINECAASTEKAMMEVSGAVHATASAAGQISSSSEEMSSGSQEQSLQTTEIAGAVEEMTKTIYSTTENILEAARLSRMASDSAVRGKEKVSDTIKGMDRIVESAEFTSSIITALTSKADQIGEITQVIEDIADQTNLLALNAAIEAARAGEQGRGFAVVADEVRKLAERTTKATKEIADTIRAIQKEVREADTSMKGAGKAVDEGRMLTNDVAAVLGDILKDTLKVTDVVNQVSAASEQQSATAEQISKNIDGISSVTQESAAGISQIARAAEDLSRLTVNLEEMVHRFRVSDKTGSRQGVMPRSSDIPVPAETSAY